MLLRFKVNCRFLGFLSSTSVSTGGCKQNWAGFSRVPAQLPPTCRMLFPVGLLGRALFLLNPPACDE